MIRQRKGSPVFKTMKWAVVIGLAIDGACIAGGYYMYHQMTNSTDFRYKVYNYDERLVDVYYRANEKYGNGSKRQEDYQKWGINNVKSFGNLSVIGL